jgi:hypothetical protein
MAGHTPRDQPAKRVRQTRDLLRNNFEAKRFDGDQAIALRIVGAKNWS